MWLPRLPDLNLPTLLLRLQPRRETPSQWVHNTKESLKVTTIVDIHLVQAYSRFLDHLEVLLKNIFHAAHEYIFSQCL